MERCPFCGSEDIYYSKKRKIFVCEDCDETLDFDVKLDEESSNFVWVSLDEIQKLPLADFQRRRISNVISYLETGKKHLDKKWAIA